MKTLRHAAKNLGLSLQLGVQSSFFAGHPPNDPANALHTQTEHLCQRRRRFAVNVALVDFSISEVSIDGGSSGESRVQVAKKHMSTGSWIKQRGRVLWWF